jgi:hypothetical protein
MRPYAQYDGGQPLPKFQPKGSLAAAVSRNGRTLERPELQTDRKSV